MMNPASDHTNLISEDQQLEFQSKLLALSNFVPLTAPRIESPLPNSPDRAWLATTPEIRDHILKELTKILKHLPQGYKDISPEKNAKTEDAKTSLPVTVYEMSSVYEMFSGALGEALGAIYAAGNLESIQQTTELMGKLNRLITEVTTAGAMAELITDPSLDHENRKGLVPSPLSAPGLRKILLGKNPAASVHAMYFLGKLSETEASPKIRDLNIETVFKCIGNAKDPCAPSATPEQLIQACESLSRIPGIDIPRCREAAASYLGRQEESNAAALQALQELLPDGAEKTDAEALFSALEVPHRNTLSEHFTETAKQLSTYPNIDLIRYVRLASHHLKIQKGYSFETGLLECVADHEDAPIAFQLLENLFDGMNTERTGQLCSFLATKFGENLHESLKVMIAKRAEQKAGYYDGVRELSQALEALLNIELKDKTQIRRIANKCIHSSNVQHMILGAKLLSIYEVWDRNDRQANRLVDVIFGQAKDTDQIKFLASLSEQHGAPHLSHQKKVLQELLRKADYTIS